VGTAQTSWEASEPARFVRNAPVPLAAKAPYSMLYAGAAATMGTYERSLLNVPTIPLPVVKPAVSALLGSLAWVLGPTSPSQRAATERIATRGESTPV
jgi:hypothetical protein